MYTNTTNCTKFKYKRSLYKFGPVSNHVHEEVSLHSTSSFTFFEFLLQGVVIAISSSDYQTMNE